MKGHAILGYGDDCKKCGHYWHTYDNLKNKVVCSLLTCDCEYTSE